MKALTLLLAASMVVATACQTAQPALPRTRGDSRTVTVTELSTATQTNLYAYVSAERPRWLQSRAPANLGGQSLTVVVFLNNQRIGGVDQLRQLPLAGVREMRYYDASEAQQRFNVRDAGGVISVITN